MLLKKKAFLDHFNFFFHFFSLSCSCYRAGKSIFRDKMTQSKDTMTQNDSGWVFSLNFLKLRRFFQYHFQRYLPCPTQFFLSDSLLGRWHEVWKILKIQVMIFLYILHLCLFLPMFFAHFTILRCLNAHVAYLMMHNLLSFGLTVINRWLCKALML